MYASLQWISRMVAPSSFDLNPRIIFTRLRDIEGNRIVNRRHGPVISKRVVLDFLRFFCNVLCSFPFQ